MNYSDTTRHLINKEVMSLVNQLNQNMDYPRPLGAIEQAIVKILDHLHKRECIMSEVTQLNTDFPDIINYKDIHIDYLDKRNNTINELVRFAGVMEQIINGEEVNVIDEDGISKND